jgi:hypothetical protein
MTTNNLIQTDHHTGYTYLPVSYYHVLNWGGLGLCDDCNTPLTDGGYLVFVLNRCLCPQCFHEWLARAISYEEDLQYQQEHQDNWYNYHIIHGRITTN